MRSCAVPFVFVEELGNYDFRAFWIYHFASFVLFSPCCDRNLKRVYGLVNRTRKHPKNLKKDISCTRRCRCFVCNCFLFWRPRVSYALSLSVSYRPVHSVGTHIFTKSNFTCLTNQNPEGAACAHGLE